MLNQAVGLKTSPVAPAEPDAGRARATVARQVWIIAIGCTALYAALCAVALLRPLWYDELLTCYIAKASTVSDVLRLVRKFDFTPPALHLLTRVSIGAFGDGSFGARLPSIVEFYAASVLLFLYARRKVGDLYAAVAVLMLWFSPVSYYATEARTYALLLAWFFGVAFFWEAAVTQPRRSAIVGLWVCSLGVVGSHVMAPFSLLPFMAAEVALFAQHRKAQFARWAGLVVPAACSVLYVPLIRSYGALLFPPASKNALWARKTTRPALRRLPCSACHAPAQIGQ